MRERSGINDQGSGGSAIGLNKVDEHSFMVRLRCDQFDPFSRSRSSQMLIDLIKRSGAVYLRLALAKEIQVRPVKYKNDHNIRKLIQTAMYNYAKAPYCRRSLHSSNSKDSAPGK